jgi:murein DD-endopeptidase MepM/ murein hydrolase activator NlpD
LATESETSQSPGDLAGLSARLARPEVWLRLASHALAIGLVLGALWLARLDFTRAREVPIPAEIVVTTAPAEATAAPAESTLPLQTLAEPLPTASGDVTRLADIHTLIPTRPRYDIVKYTVQRGDTLFGIASKFNVKPETVLWGNAQLAENPNILSAGQVLNILPIDGALRIVQPGDTLEKIAQVFHGTVEEIVNYPGNDLDPDDPQIKDGQYLVIPGGWRELVQWQLPSVTRTTRGLISSEPGACAGPFSGPSGTYTFVWPANNHYLSGWDYLPNAHPGIDIAAGLGAPIYASDTGVIVFAGWSTRGYGNLIIVDHGNGWQTAYAHLSQINVVCGQGVFQGNLIGLSGSTGNSSGAHLHFEMRHSEYGRVNPWLYLP